MLIKTVGIDWYNAKVVRPNVKNKTNVWAIYGFDYCGKAHVMDVMYENGLFNGSEKFDKDVLYWAYMPSKEDIEGADERDDF